MIRFTTAGESHGKALVGVLEGIPAGLSVVADDINRQLRRRMAGYGRGARMKLEVDEVEILSGVRAGETLGSPIALLIPNRDWVNWGDIMGVEPDPPGRMMAVATMPIRLAVIAKIPSQPLLILCSSILHLS